MCSVVCLQTVLEVDEKKAMLEREVERVTNEEGLESDRLAELYEAQHVLDPRDTRAWLIRTLEIHRKGMKNGVGDHLLRNWPTSY